MTITEKVLRAIEERADRINGCAYGEVTVLIENEKVVLVKVAGKYKPIPKHACIDKDWRDAAGNVHIPCICGSVVMGKNYAHALNLMHEHISKND